MNSGIYIKNIFDAVKEPELRNYVRDYDERRQTLNSIFSVMPQRATEFSAGYDLSILNDEVIPPHESKLIAFGDTISIENPSVTAVVVPRSSLARKRGLILADGPQYVYSGSGYHCLVLKFINYLDTEVTLKAGEKIAQVLFIKYPSWIVGDFNAMCDIESADPSILPDPLDEMYMSPMLDKNLEVMSFVKEHSSYTKIDQTDRVSYYFQSPEEVTLEPGKVVCIMTGLRSKIENDQVFLLKGAFNNPCVELANSIGVIDADYYDNPDNGGEIGVLLLNRGCRPIKVHDGDLIASGAIYYYEKAEGDVYGGKRIGGFGSTSQK